MLGSISAERFASSASVVTGDKALDAEERRFFSFVFFPSTIEEFGVSGTARLQMLVSNRAKNQVLSLTDISKILWDFREWFGLRRCISHGNNLRQ